MNYIFSKSNIKGKDDVTLTLLPTDNLERELFKTMLSSGQVEIKEVTGKEEYVLQRKEEKE